MFTCSLDIIKYVTEVTGDSWRVCFFPSHNGRFQVLILLLCITVKNQCLLFWSFRKWIHYIFVVYQKYSLCSRNLQNSRTEINDDEIEFYWLEHKFSIAKNYISHLFSNAISKFHFMGMIAWQASFFIDRLTTSLFLNIIRFISVFVFLVDSRQLVKLFADEFGMSNCTNVIALKLILLDCRMLNMHNAYNINCKFFKLRYKMVIWRPCNIKSNIIIIIVSSQ